MYDENQLNTEFIADALWKHGERLTELFKQTLTDVKLIDTGDLIASLKFDVQKPEQKLEYTFKTYGRIHDLDRKRQSKFVFEAPDTNADVWGVKASKNKTATRVNRKWYARTMYGSLNTLYASICWGMTEELREVIKQRIIEQNRELVTNTTAL